MNLMRGPKNIVRKWLWVHAVHHTLDNWRMRRQRAHGKFQALTGSTHRKLQLDQSLAYINQVFDDYFVYGDLDAPRLEGARVLELGPGDNFGVALRFLGKGASQVVCWDRFFSERNVEQQRTIYRALVAQMPPSEQRLVEKAIDLDAPDLAIDTRRIRYHFGKGIEEALGILDPESFDLIVSRAVLEHLYDPAQGLNVMHGLLRSGGRMAHKIDFRDHGMFTGSGFPALTFLRFRSKTWDRMTRDSGKPNRCLLPFYRERMTALGHRTVWHLCSIAGRPGEVLPHVPVDAVPGVVTEEERREIATIRRRLAPAFQELTDEDLAVSAVFLQSTKP